MDDVEITDVEDENAPFQVDRTHLENQDMSFVSLSVAELLSQYGWHLLVVSVLVYVLIQQLMKRFRWRKDDSGAQTQQDTEAVVRNQEAMEAARRRMQEELDAKAAVFREKQKQLEEEKRRQKIEMWDSLQQGKSYKGAQRASEASEEAGSSTSTMKPKTNKKSLRGSDYNPLTRDGGGSCSWRPGRRGPSAGG